MTTTPDAPGTSLERTTLRRDTPKLQLRFHEATTRRAAAGLDTDAALARMMGLDRANVARVLAGTHEPSARFIAALCFVLDADVNDLFVVLPPTN